jgi:hypothetical protein
MIMRKPSSIALVCVVLCLAGCGGPSLAPVSGTVTLDGKPVDGIRVTFEPILDKLELTGAKYYRSFGITDEQGRYTMQTEVDGRLRPGAVVGNATVRLVCTKRDAFMNKGLEDSRAVHDLPASAQDKSIRYTVERAGSAEAHFHLSR